MWGGGGVVNERRLEIINWVLANSKLRPEIAPFFVLFSEMVTHFPRHRNDVSYLASSLICYKKLVV